MSQRNNGKNTLYNYFISPARQGKSKSEGNTVSGSSQSDQGRGAESDAKPKTFKSPSTPKVSNSPGTPKTCKVTPNSLKSFKSPSTPKVSNGHGTPKTPKDTSKTPKRKTNGVSEKPAPLKTTSGRMKVPAPVFQIYDIVWSKLQGYPLWPSLICYRPKTLKYSKNDKIHVQFFDHPPTRAWVNKSHVEVYRSGSDQAVPNKNVEAWKKATVEADKALMLSREEREKLITIFTDFSEDEDESDIESDNNAEPPLKKVLLDSEDSEDDYKPGAEDVDDASDSCSSGVNSEEESFSTEEPEESPRKKRKRSQNKGNAVKRVKQDIAKPSTSSIKVLSKDTKKGTEIKTEGFSNEWAHLHYEFLKPDKIRDAKRRLPDDPEYEPRTLYIPQDFMTSLTPAMRQWWDVKAQNYDCVLFFKVGKFYELYHMDAVTGVNELGLIFMKGDFAHSGFPEISYSRFSSSLVEKGYKVARVEQTETPAMMAERLQKVLRPKKIEKVVKREVCQITTKGTRTCSVIDGDEQMASARYLLALIEKEYESNKSSFGVCFVDTSIGVFHIGQFNDDKFFSQLRMLLAHHPPVQVLYSKKTCSEETHRLLHNVLTSVIKEPISKSELWSADKALLNLAEGEYFPKSSSGGINWPEGLKPFLSETDALGLSPKDEYSLAVCALGAITWYLKKCLLDQKVLSMGQFKQYYPSSTSMDAEKICTEEISPKHMVLDGNTLRNLDVLQSAGGEEEGSLLHLLDFCSTRFGKRLLREWICFPLCNISSIKSRQEAINDLLKNPDLVKSVKEKLSRLPDLEKLLASIHAQGSKLVNKLHPDSRAIFYEDNVYSKRRIQKFIASLSGFKLSTEILALFQDDDLKLSSTLLLQVVQTTDRENGQFPLLEESLSFFNSAFDHEVASKEGKIMPEDGVDPEYDSAAKEIATINQELQDYLEEQRRFFGCKITYFGNDKKRFQLEVPEASARKAGNEYEMQSQRKGFKRFVTPQTKNLLAKLIRAEEQKKNVVQDLSRRIFEQFSLKYEMWSNAIRCLSVLDVLLSLTTYVEQSVNICVPLFENCNQPFIKIKDGQHPCLIGKIDGLVSNDTSIGCKDCNDKNSNLMLLTGPNMGGKSTLMRQVGLLIIMAHMGCHVPAAECHLSPVDRIFTRIGASDDIMAGESTFFVELSETSVILRQATKHSFVLVDELGRGTSTHDGTAIAAATVEELVKKECRTVFSTHYHSLVEDFKNTPDVALWHMACDVKENNEDPSQDAVTFLYKLETGACPKSYGFNAAHLGGIPSFITSRAFMKAKKLEEQSKRRKIFRDVFLATDLSTITERIKEL